MCVCVCARARMCVLTELPLCDIPSGGGFFTGPWTVPRSSLRMLRRVAAFCRPLRPVLLLVAFPRSRSPVVGVPGLCWMWQDVPFVRQRRPVVGVLRLCWLLPGSFDCFCCPCASVHRAPPPPFPTNFDPPPWNCKANSPLRSLLCGSGQAGLGQRGAKGCPWGVHRRACGP